MLLAPVPWPLGRHAAEVEARLQRWEQEDAVGRLWAKDPTLWTAEPEPEIEDRLGWLTLPETMRGEVPALEVFAAEVAASGVTHVVLLGMGGSSLAPEVFARTLGPRPGYPTLLVLDSTHPDAVRAVDEQTDPAATLFVVSSKSGTTIEPNSFLAHCWERAASLPDRGAHFVAVTDPGTSLATLGRERGFRRVFEAPPDVGGRFSALSHFGLVPAALIGADISRLLDRATTAASACRRPPADNPGFLLGAVLGELARAGRDKATFLVSPALEALPAWIEQLIAESTGKQGTGILPVAGEPVGPPEAYGDDRLFVHLSLGGAEEGAQAAALGSLEAAGHPVVRLHLNDPGDLGAEMYRQEVATAMAGSVLGIHPFNQPDVQLAKTLATRAMAGEVEGDAIPATLATDPEALAAALDGLLGGARSGDYLAVQAFVAPTPQAQGALQGLRVAVRDRLRIATTVGFGPRFLHSTGQLHKGGGDQGLFLQIVDDAAPDLPVPGTDYTFGRLVSAQADGDYRALAAKGRRLLRVDLNGDPVGGLGALEESIAP
ncbi:MAG: glucose-6-phosphate isomerase [Acidimicrobiia bacterium]|nr:glucose-6-phosphate isomerase [Acidimicrobiia bacterium]